MTIDYSFSFPCILIAWNFFLISAWIRKTITNCCFYREKPEEGTCLGVFGLSLYTTERELDKEFSKFGPLQKVQVVLDGKVGIVMSKRK